MSGKLYPDNYFSVSVNFRRKKKEKRAITTNASYSSLISSKTPEVSNVKEFANFNQIQDCPTSNRFIQPHESSQQKKKYGLRGITPLGKRTLKSCSVLLQKEYGAKRIGFLTLTLPTITPEVADYISLNWSNIQRVFFQKLRRRLQNCSAPLDIIACTEIQSKRFRTSGVFCLHLHVLYVCRSSPVGPFYLHASTLRELWHSVVSYYIYKGFGISYTPEDFKASVDCQVIKKDVGKYLSKYLSKGGVIVQEAIDKGYQSKFPSQWWTISSTLREKFRKSIKKIDDSIALLIFDNPEELLKNNLIAWFKEIYIELSKGSKKVAVVGYLSKNSPLHGCNCI